MKTIKYLIAVTMLLPAIALAEVKIGVVDPMAAIFETNEVKQRTAAIEAEVKEQEGKLRKLRDEIVGLEDRLKKEEMTLGKDEKRELTDKRDAKMFEFRSMQQTIQKRVNEDQQELVELMRPKFELAVSTVADDKDLDLVLNKQAAIYTNGEFDITREVTQKINSMKK